MGISKCIIMQDAKTVEYLIQEGPKGFWEISKGFPWDISHISVMEMKLYKI